MKASSASSTRSSDMTELAALERIDIDRPDLRDLADGSSPNIGPGPEQLRAA
jgi:hypothetical protein